MNTQVIKDCSQGFCSFYCPQWCYIILPPPPPPLPLPSSGPDFSPLVITIIGFLGGALLLLSYYAILSSYCRRRSSSITPTNIQNDRHVDVDVEAGQSPVAHEPWFVAADGLDEAVIGSIATFKYRRREGLVEGTDCSVCLSEFVEDERLKLLPKCSHAFHVSCIDTWLRCHSNCPLCRAHVAAAAGAVSPPPPVRGEGVEESLEVGNGSGGGEGSRPIRRSVSMVDVMMNRGEEDEMELERNGGREVECQFKRSLSSGRWFASKCGKLNSPI